MTGRKTKQNEVAGAYVLKLNCSLMFVVWFLQGAATVYSYRNTFYIIYYCLLN